MLNNFFNTLKNYTTALYIFSIIICIFFIPFFYNTTISSSTQSSSTVSNQTLVPSNNNSQIITSTNISWPLPGYTRISSYFGYRKAPTVGATSFHGGVDIPAPQGSNIISAISGKVTRTAFMGSGGCSLVIQNDTYTIIYHHVSPNYIVSVGDYVFQGQVVAQVGPKNVYGFSNNPYKDSKRKPYKWCYYWTTFAFYCKTGKKLS